MLSIDEIVVKSIPILSSCIEFRERIFYAYCYGIGIASFDLLSYEKLFYDESYLGWGGYHFSICYQGKIVFAPATMNSILVFDPVDNTEFTVSVPQKKDNEVLIPYLSGNELILFGAESQITYCVDPDFTVRILDRRCEDNTIWLTYLSQTEKYICLWNSEASKIGIIQKEEKELRTYEYYYGNISSAAVHDEKCYVLTTEGDVDVISLQTGTCEAIIRTGIKANNNNVMIFNDKCLFIMPSSTNEIIKMNIEDEYKVTVTKLNIHVHDKKLMWCKLKDGIAICEMQHNVEAWKYKTVFFEYDLNNGIIIEYPLDMMLRSSIFDDKNEGIKIDEDRIHCLRDFIELVERR